MPHQSLKQLDNSKLQQAIDKWHNSPELSNVRLFNPIYNRLIREYERRVQYQIT